MKVLLGEVAKESRLVKIERIVASKDEMLDALFERTYVALTPAAKRVYLTLCRWRSLIPQIALEAVLIRPTNEKMDVEAAIDELVRSSFIESMDDESGARFITVPLVGAVFGRRKVEFSPMKVAIEADVELLQEIGATRVSGLAQGVQPRIERLFRYAANEMSRDSLRYDEYIPMLEFLCRRYVPAWLMLAALFEETGMPNGLTKAKDAIRRLLERAEDSALCRHAWEELARLCQQTQDWSGEIQALVGSCKVPNTPFSTLSNAANRLNAIFKEDHLVLNSEEKRIVVRELVELLERRLAEADATDLSRLAWLCLHIGDDDRARQHVKSGLALDSANQYCVNLRDRLL